MKRPHLAETVRHPNIRIRHVKVGGVGIRAVILYAFPDLLLGQEVEVEAVVVEWIISALTGTSVDGSAVVVRGWTGRRQKAGTLSRYCSSCWGPRYSRARSSIAHIGGRRL
jgi:hypothetical protein